MSFIQAGRSATLAFFMAALALVSFGPVARAASNNESVRSDSTFDVALSVNNKTQSARIEVSPEAQYVLGQAHGASARGGVQLQNIVQERLQQLISEGKVQVPEGAVPHVIVKAERGAELRPSEPQLADTCFVPATYSVTYYIYFDSPSCSYYVATDYYNALYDQCTNTVYVMDYIGSTVVGPYSCG